MGSPEPPPLKVCPECGNTEWEGHTESCRYEQRLQGRVPWNDPDRTWDDILHRPTETG